MAAGIDVALVLREHGHRVTAPRLAVWQALVDHGGHLTVKELLEQARRHDRGVNLASVYRSLDLFAELGLARESHTGDDAAEWELSHPDDHFHVVCDTCGRVDHHAGGYVADIRAHLHADHGFEATVVELRVTGRCAGCAAFSATE